MEKISQIAWFREPQMENEPRIAALVIWRHTEVHSFLGASVASLRRSKSASPNIPRDPTTRFKSFTP